MTPGAHIEEIRQRLNALTDQHPLCQQGPGWMIISDLQGDLKKLEQFYNQVELLNERKQK